MLFLRLTLLYYNDLLLLLSQVVFGYFIEIYLYSSFDGNELHGFIKNIFVSTSINSEACGCHIVMLD